jgi:hypothetical protein
VNAKYFLEKWCNLGVVSHTLAHINTALSKAKLQWPKGISHFRHPVTPHENDSEGSEYSDSDAHGQTLIMKALSRLLTSSSPFPSHAKQDCELLDHQLVPDETQWGN